MAASKLSVTLLDNADATGNPVEWPGGFGRVEIRGTFGGASVTMQVLDADGSTYYTVGSDAVFSASGTTGFYLEAGAMIRMLVSGGTPSALYAAAHRIG